MKFQLNQALYHISGRKIGWVVGINAGSGSARVKCHGSEAELTIPVSDLISGAIKTKADLRSQQIPRITPTLILPGNRLWEGHLYRGAITRIIHRDLVSHDYVCHTDFGGAVSSSALYEGTVTIGRRSHTTA